MIKKNRISLIIIFLMIIFIIISNSLLTNDINQFDNFIYTLIVSPLPSIFTPAMIIITNLASVPIIITITIIVVCYLKNKAKTRIILFNILNMIIITELFKSFFLRERPTNIALIKEIGFSFPSGHTIISISFYGLIIYFITQSSLRKITKKLFITGIITIITLICYSRIYLGVHYASDVLAGICLSTAYLLSYIKIINRYI